MFKRDSQDINGLVQDCSNSIALAMELLQPCAKPSISVYSVQWLNSIIIVPAPNLGHQ